MFEKLFGNPGAKLRILANIMFCLFVIAGIVLGILFAADGTAILLPVCVVGGFIVGWLWGLSLHLFASIAENLHYINKNVYTTTELIEKKNNS